MTIVLQDMPTPMALEGPLSADQALQGMRFPPQQQILLYSPGEWENFVHEWAHYTLKGSYVQVQRLTGAGDRGIDVAGFIDADKLQGVWDNYQCKHYDHSLYPSDIWVEVGKMLWYSFQKEFLPPRRYYFVAPRGIGTTLNAFIANKPKFKAELLKNWDRYCRNEIRGTGPIAMEGEFQDYVNAFDFSIFDAKTPLDLVSEHSTCPYHAARFGGGLRARMMPDPPPEDIAEKESRYVEQLMEAYSDHTKETVSLGEISKWPKLKSHFLRQREGFYHAESLRVFARDSVPNGTFEALQEDIFRGVIDTHDEPHPDGYDRVRAVTKAARDMQITANALITRSSPTDRDGICHQLANEDRLRWTGS